MQNCAVVLFWLPDRDQTACLRPIFGGRSADPTASAAQNTNPICNKEKYVAELKHQLGVRYILTFIQNTRSCIYI
jgi:hypothetical protein